eukprot:6710006-Pyramimonas_sp.AAC.1
MAISSGRSWKRGSSCAASQVEVQGGVRLHPMRTMLAIALRSASVAPTICAPLCMAGAARGCATALPILAKQQSLLNLGSRIFMLTTLFRLAKKPNARPPMASVSSTSGAVYCLKLCRRTCCATCCAMR